jgi:hypothetical protein
MKIAKDLSDTILRYSHDPVLPPRRKTGRKHVSQSYTVIEAAKDLMALGVNQDTIDLIWRNAASDKKGVKELPNKVGKLLKEKVKDRESAFKKDIAEAKKKKKAIILDEQNKAKAITNFCRKVRDQPSEERADQYLQELVTRIAAYKKTNKNWAAKVKKAVGMPGEGSVYEVLSKHVHQIWGVTFTADKIRKRMERVVFL